jgi:hypothetical protein
MPSPLYIAIASWPSGHTFAGLLRFANRLAGGVLHVRVFLSKTRVGTTMEVCRTLPNGRGDLAMNERMSALLEAMLYIIIVSDM